MEVRAENETKKKTEEELTDSSHSGQNSGGGQECTH